LGDNHDMGYVYGAPRDPTAVVGRRIAAYLLDGLLVLIALLVVLARVKHTSFTNAPADACSILRARNAGNSSSVMCVGIASRAWLWKRSDFLTAIDVAALVGILDLVVLQAVTGASAGKHALGLVVVDAHGKPAGFGRMIVRSLVLVVDGGIFLIGLIAVLSTRFHRRLGDLAAGTYVVAKASAGQVIALAPSAVPYGGAFAVPGAGPPSGFAAPAAPAALVPGWGVALVAPPLPPPPPPPPPNPASAAWNAPPSTTLPARPPAASPPAASPAAPSPPPSNLPPPAPSPPVPPPPAPIAAPPLPAPPVQPAVPEPKHAVAPERQAVPQPEAWWDTAIPPADPPDGEEQP
jgi:uncharacterized RDD family membrane protein YckC